MKKTCFILSLLFLLFLPNTSAALLADNLIGYWKFDNNTVDSSGGGRDLTLQNGAGFSSGLRGQALLLDSGSQQYAQRPENDNIYNFGASDFTIQVWVNFSTFGREQVLMEKFQTATGPAWTLTYYPYYGDNRFHFYTTYEAVRIYSDPVEMEAGQWQQVIVRRTDSNFELFFNDRLIGSLTYAGALQDTSSPLLMGMRNSADGRGFFLNGMLDEVAIWNRALTDEEIARLYNLGSGYEIPTGPATAPIDIKPGSDPNSINPKSNGKIPVAILSSEKFYAPEMVDKDSLTFGPTGDEDSLAFCNHRGEDINGDGLEDLICHFYTEDTGFLCGDTEGVLKGITMDGTPIEGKDSVRIVPCKK